MQRRNCYATLLALNQTPAPEYHVMEVKCPYCHREIDNNFIRSEVAKQMGSVKSPRKKKDPKEMARIGKLGAKNRWAKHRAKEK